MEPASGVTVHVAVAVTVNVGVYVDVSVTVKVGVSVSVTVDVGDTVAVRVIVKVGGAEGLCVIVGVIVFVNKGPGSAGVFLLHPAAIHTNARNTARHIIFAFFMNSPHGLSDPGCKKIAMPA